MKISRLLIVAILISRSVPAMAGPLNEVLLEFPPMADAEWTVVNDTDLYIGLPNVPEDIALDVIVWMPVGSGSIPPWNLIVADFDLPSILEDPLPLMPSVARSLLSSLVAKCDNDSSSELDSYTLMSKESKLLVEATVSRITCSPIVGSAQGWIADVRTSTDGEYAHIVFSVMPMPDRKAADFSDSTEEAFGFFSSMSESFAKDGVRVCLAGKTECKGLSTLHK